MKNCKHPIKSISIQNHYDSAPDGYGGTSEWNWNELECSSCKKSLKCDSRNLPYYELTGRSLDMNECQKLFVQNRSLYGILNISSDRHDLILRSVGKRTDALAKKIKAKKKVLKSINKNLRQCSRIFTAVVFHTTR